MDQKLSSLNQSTSVALGAALLRVLRPVVRLMLARGVKLAFVVELLKRAYVEEAQAIPAEDGDVSRLTGVSRTDVKRLSALPPDDAPGLPPAVSLGARLVSVWMTRSPWIDAEGAARPLFRGGDDASFAALVASVSPETDAGPLLDHWLRLGVVRIDECARVTLNQPAFVPHAGIDEKLAYLALNVGDHAAAAVDNTLGRADPWFERSVHYRGVSPALVARLRRQASELGTQSLQILNVEAQRAAEATDDGATRSRFTFGVYFHAEDLPPRSGD